MLARVRPALRTHGARSMSMLRNHGAGNAELLAIHPIPTHEEARNMPRHVSELTGEGLYLLAEHGGHTDAVRERLRREIMAVDGIDYVDTSAVIMKMNEQNSEGLAMAKAPYQLAIYTALISGWASLPLVFHFPTASVFNDYCVTAEAPEVGAADTALEVGSWSWGWMEPPLGTISFFLLCIQFAKEQRVNLGQKPLTENLREQMGARLVVQYPQYAPTIVRAYSEATAMIDDASSHRGIGATPSSSALSAALSYEVCRESVAKLFSK